MLKYLHIENIAVIEQANIDFSDGFNVLTGETGAGKSIIIDAINAVLGERTSKELIRNGCDSAVVSAQFDNLSGDCLELLRENGLSADENGEIYISRMLSYDKKAGIRINGQAVTAAVLREIGKRLISIHGQHDNQNLLNPDKHLGYLDRMSDNEKLRADYLEEFLKFRNIRRELESLETDEDEKLRRIDYLKYEIDELTKADVKIGETSALKENISVARGFEKTSELLKRALLSLNGTDDTSGIMDGIAACRKELAVAAMRELEPDIAALEDITYRLHDISSHIENLCDNSQYSPENLNNMIERLDLIHSLMLKYGDSEEKLLAALESAVKELDRISFSETRMRELEEALAESQDALIKKAALLTESRRSAAKEFSKSVCGILEYLDMPNVRFAVNFEKGRYTRDGCDVVEFYISANAGEAPKPLSKIASGGELSRVMLAIQNVLLDRDDVPTLIFDEIDTGISGRAADKVGIVMRHVAGRHQVICVTHLAQIAANAHTHFLIEKSTRNNRTYTQLTALDYEGRITEIARIMSGTDMTENMYNSARELLDRSFNNGNL